MLVFDTDAFIREHFRDANGIVGMLRAYGLRCPPYDTARKWVARGTVPSEWFPVIVAVLELDNGEAISLIKYLIVEGPNG